MAIEKTSLDEDSHFSWLSIIHVADTVVMWMSFGVTLVQEVFGDLPGVTIDNSNITLWGTTKKEHDELWKLCYRDVKINLTIMKRNANLGQPKKQSIRVHPQANSLTEKYVQIIKGILTIASETISQLTRILKHHNTQSSITNTTNYQ